MRNKVNKNTIWESSVLVLLIGVIMRYTVDMASDSIIYIQSFMKICSGIQVISWISVEAFEYYKGYHLNDL
jgi:hypothetical protein